jgi:glycine/D-amino acid oxidase-like deaminating enzyme
VRVCIAGGGLAGSLLAWRLAQQSGVDVHLLLGHDGGRDATGASGGAVRGYESLPRQRELAIASMAELLASPVLRAWGDYRQTGFVYLPGGAEDQPGSEEPGHAGQPEGSISSNGLAGAIAEIESHLPGSAELTTAGAAFGDAAGPGESAELGPVWAGPPDAIAVVERQAGYISPARLRDAVLADLARRGVAITPAPLTALLAPPAGPVRVTSAAATTEHDQVVLASGAWTPGLLRAIGLPANGYRTKSVEYGIYPVDRYCPPSFADAATGLYGKPAAGGLLLGVPTTGWDVPPGRPAADLRWHERAVELAARLFPRLRLGPAIVRVSAVDCYCEPPVLCLRPVTAGQPGLCTFTGGSGGAVKTVLAASREAAAALSEPGALAGPGSPAGASGGPRAGRDAGR